MAPSLTPSPGQTPARLIPPPSLPLTPCPPPALCPCLSTMSLPLWPHSPSTGQASFSPYGPLFQPLPWPPGLLSPTPRAEPAPSLWEAPQCPGTRTLVPGRQVWQPVPAAPYTVPPDSLSIPCTFLLAGLGTGLPREALHRPVPPVKLPHQKLHKYLLPHDSDSSTTVD